MDNTVLVPYPQLASFIELHTFLQEEFGVIFCNDPTIPRYGKVTTMNLDGVIFSVPTIELLGAYFFDTKVFDSDLYSLAIIKYGFRFLTLDDSLRDLTYHTREKFSKIWKDRK